MMDAHPLWGGNRMLSASMRTCQDVGGKGGTCNVAAFATRSAGMMGMPVAIGGAKAKKGIAPADKEAMQLARICLLIILAPHLLKNAGARGSAPYLENSSPFSLRMD